MATFSSLHGSSSAGPALVYFARAPVALVAHQVPPRPWPLMSHDLVSPENRYSGQPPTVTCMLPSARATVPIRALSMPSTVTPAGSVVSSGGQLVAQSPMQLDFDGLPVSLSNRYTERPSPSTTIWPSDP